MADIFRDAIVEQLKTVPNIGVVHGYQRYAARLEKLAELYSTGDQLRGWFVRRIEVVERTQDSLYFEIRKRWLIRGYLALQDEKATEQAFDDLLDAIRDAFQSKDWYPELPEDNSLLDEDEGEQYGLSIDAQEPVMFAGVLCHSARCSLITRQWRPRDTYR